MRQSKTTKLAILFSLFTLLCACSTAVTFNSNRPQEVKVNGMRVGTTPTTVSLSDAVWEDYHVVYTDLETGEETHFQATKEIKVGTFIGGLFLLPIFLWCYGPQASQYREVNNNIYVNPAVDPEYEEYLRQKAEAEAAQQAADEEAARREYEEYLWQKAQAEEAAKAAEEEAARREYEEFQAFKKAKAEAEANKNKNK